MVFEGTRHTSMMRRKIPNARHIGILLCLLALGGCANSMPFFSEMIPDEAPSTTGSLFSPSATLSNELTAADWDKANAALDTALKPDNTSLPVQWENRSTSARGNFRPLGVAFVKEFASQITIENVARPSMQAIACRNGASDWRISDVKRLTRQG
jgi:hypothetical protein